MLVAGVARARGLDAAVSSEFLGGRLGIVAVRSRSRKRKYISIIIRLIIFVGSEVVEQEKMCNAMEGMRSKRIGCNISAMLSSD